MKKKFKFGVIGAGFMASAIVNGLLVSKKIKAKNILVSDVCSQNLQKMAQKGVKTTTDNLILANNCEFVLFAIKPQNANDVLQEIQTSSCNKFISIMAGVKKDKIKKFFPNASVARCMPNTPCSIGAGAVAIDVSDYTEDTDTIFIKDVFSSLADVVFVNEDLLNAVTGISGSSPAYYYLFLKGIINAGIKNGLDEESAKRLATATMIGAGKMVQANTNKSIDDLISAVCSKGGTTIEAVKVFEDGKLSDLIDKAVASCINRAKELENL